MRPGTIVCARCGWRNMVGDRMCGGCGQPLTYSGSAFGAVSDASPTVAASGPIAPAPPPLPPSARTATWAAPAAPHAQPQPQPYTAGSATVLAPSRAMPPRVAASAPARAKGGSCLSRALISLSVAALLLVVLLACGWTAFLRPALHASFDQKLRAALAAEVDKVPAIPAGYPPITQTIPESAFNQQPATSAGSGDMKDVRIHLLPGEVTMTYLLWNNPGKITTHIVAINGRLFVQNTQVAGLLNQVENGGELQDALNESLARLPAQDYVERVIVGQGTLTLTIRHA